MTECYECSKLAELRAENNALHVEVDRLTRQNISLARDLGECMTERDVLRHARDLAGFSMVDMNGEVVG